MKKMAILLALALLGMVAAPSAFADDAAALYKTKCASCHAADASGSTPMGKKLNVRDLRSPDVQKQTDAQLTEITTKGKNKMPAYEKKLTAEQIKELVACIRELGKKK